MEVTVKGRDVTVKGERGTLEKSFNHLQVNIIKLGKRSMKVEMWWGNKKQAAAVRTTCSHITNMIVGVTKGFLYKMRFVHAHFPINAAITNGGKTIEVRNFLGEKRVRVVDMLEGVKVDRSTQKDEIIITGNDIEKVSQSCASIHGCTLAKNKDIRMFLDGIYVSEKLHIQE